MLSFKPAVTVSITFICVVIYLFPTLSAALIYDRAGVSDGKIWLLISGHFVHYTSAHLLLNLIMFITFGVLMEFYNRYDYVRLIIFSLFLMALCQQFYLLNMQYYAGLSGLVTAIVTFLAIQKIQTDKTVRSLWAVMLLLIFIKILFEFLNGGSIFELDAGESFKLVPEIHLTGVIAACILTIFTPDYRFWRKNNQPTKASEA